MKHFKTGILLLFFVLTFNFAAFSQDKEKPKVVGEVTVNAKYANANPLYQKIRTFDFAPDIFLYNRCSKMIFFY